MESISKDCLEKVFEIWVREAFLTREDIAHLRGAFSTRGKGKGFLLRNLPPLSKGSMTRAAWNGAMLSVNPFKVSVFGFVCSTPEEKDLSERVTKAFDAMGAHKARFDRDRLALTLWGAW